MARVARSESVEIISEVERTTVRRSLHRLVRWLVRRETCLARKGAFENRRVRSMRCADEPKAMLSELWTDEIAARRRAHDASRIKIANRRGAVLVNRHESDSELCILRALPR